MNSRSESSSTVTFGPKLDTGEGERLRVARGSAGFRRIVGHWEYRVACEDARGHGVFDTDFILRERPSVGDLDAELLRFVCAVVARRCRPVNAPILLSSE